MHKTYQPSGVRPLPPRLGDPLTFTRNTIFASAFGCLLLVLILYCAIAMGDQHHDNDNFDFVAWWLIDNAGVVSAPIVVAGSYCLLCWPLLLILPFRRTNAFYLRAFRGDDQTSALRLSICKGLGRGYRLSGIRAPAKRSSVFLRHLFLSFYCLRYSTVKHMNLEADEDWFARLWTSLGDARCAFVDLTDLTEYVVSEVSLVYRRLGPRRVMFLGDESRTEHEWRELVALRFGIDDEEALKLWVVTWEHGPRWNPSVLIARVREFANQLPPGTARSESVGSAPGVDPPPWNPTDRRQRFCRNIQALAGFLCIPLTLCVTNYISMESRNPIMGSNSTSPLNRTINSIALLLLVSFLLISYFSLCFSSIFFFFNCGTGSGRLKSVVIIIYYISMCYPIYYVVTSIHKSTLKSGGSGVPDGIY